MKRVAAIALAIVFAPTAIKSFITEEVAIIP
jgi:hypothetical protein